VGVKESGFAWHIEKMFDSRSNPKSLQFGHRNRKEISTMNERLTLTPDRLLKRGSCQNGIIVLVCTLWLSMFIPASTAQVDFVQMHFGHPANYAALGPENANRQELRGTNSGMANNSTAGNKSRVRDPGAFYEPSIETLFFGCIAGLLIIKLSAKIR
jgi:hypothetical protein